MVVTALGDQDAWPTNALSIGLPTPAFACRTGIGLSLVAPQQKSGEFSLENATWYAIQNKSFFLLSQIARPGGFFVSKNPKFFNS
ncbi:MAG: hypothetical protein HQM03_00735 [Magnetococcales bacterium]|nr:hypothetical protein [Magnetococcales bacterium]